MLSWMHTLSTIFLVSSIIKDSLNFDNQRWNYHIKNYSGFSASYICDDDIVANKDEKFQDQVGSDHAVQNEPIVKKTLQGTGSS